MEDQNNEVHFGIELKNVIASAQNLAKELNHNEVVPGHLLHSLALNFQGHNGFPTAVEYHSILSKSPIQKSNGHSALELNKRCKEVLRDAVKIAESEKSKETTVEHLWRAMQSRLDTGFADARNKVEYLEKGKASFRFFIGL